MQVPEPHAIFPLTLFDILLVDATVSFSWLIKGKPDTQLIRSAIGRVVQKWPLLAGRVEYSKNEYPYPLQLRVPLSPDLNELKEEYKTFEFTETTSSVPLSQYVQLPIPTVHPSLPSSLTRHTSTPRRTYEWIAQSLPLLWWHVTRFPSSVGGPGITDDYAVIGLSFSHGVFDGAGAAFVLHAVEAEMYNRDWKVPPLLHEGLNENPLTRDIGERTEALPSKEREHLGRYKLFIPAGVLAAARAVCWTLWENYWNGATEKTLVLSSKMVNRLVDGVKDELIHEGITIRVTTGDILAAWMYKTIYSGDSPGKKSTFLTYVGSYRPIFAPEGSLDSYLHNCFLLLPYPLFTLSELQAIPLHELSSTLAQVRESRSPEGLLDAYAFLENSFTKAKPLAHWLRYPGADETLSMSNKTVFKIGEIDWGRVGGRETMCSYQTVFGPYPMSNWVGMNGWIKGIRCVDEDRLVIQMALSREKWAKVESAVDMLEKEVERGLNIRA
ncbi:hypothetical protein BDN72DRAFT_770884 [Pluteus cervinus]|uniref:Uncharacterized protein n=1 Tax=Pluteus cervinus TaxID=181527 RepID=A0ACD3ANR9_9AGAR|nr:hypothetical protein BDN72DRAFT_770884 [Pluteus cervinus]